MTKFEPEAEASHSATLVNLVNAAAADLCVSVSDGGSSTRPTAAIIVTIVIVILIIAGAVVFLKKKRE